MVRTEGEGRGALTLAVILMAAPAWGQGVAREAASAGDFPNVAVRVSITAGAGIPAGAVFRDVYGSRVVPLGVQVDWRLAANGLGVLGGVRWVSSTGEAIVDGSSRPGGERVEFRMTSWRAGPSWSLLRGAWAVTGAAGLAYNRYREEWEAAGQEPEGSGLGSVFQATVERRLTRRVSALVRVERAFFDADAPEDTGLGRVSLGSTDIAGGIGVRF